MTGFGDKRQVTILFTVSMAGLLLPPQVIYKGSTDRVHPRNTMIPDDWDMTHTANHWSTESSMLRFLDNIIIPYVEGIRVKLKSPSQKAIAIFDLFAAHRCTSVLKKLEDNNIMAVFIPGRSTTIPCQM